MKKRISKIIFASLVFVILIAAVFAISASANEPREEQRFYYYDEATGSYKSELTSSKNPTLITADMTTLTDGWYIAEGNVLITTRLYVSGDVHIILRKGAELKVWRGIGVNEGNSLSIYSEMEDGTDFNAGNITCISVIKADAAIGSDQNATSGDITIHGGYIDVEGGYNSAAIGSGYRGKLGKVEIYGGRIYATGGGSYGGPGIGSGYQAQSGGTIHIAGGLIYAYAPSGNQVHAGAIGGSQSYPEKITISGGEVEASGEDTCPGIGSSYSNFGTINITGGKVTAKGGANSSAIGGGRWTQGGTVNITGGTVTANGGSFAAGIGEGADSNGTDVKTYINISGGTVTATGGDSGAGIGSARYGRNVYINISGGTVTANGGSSASAIGSGERSSFSCTVNISGGNVKAFSASSGSAIGVHKGSAKLYVDISGGTIVAQCNDADGVAIGSAGDGPNDSYIKISGGVISAGVPDNDLAIGCQYTAESYVMTLTGGVLDVNGKIKWGTLITESDDGAPGNAILNASSLEFVKEEERHGIINGVFYGETVTPTDSFTVKAPILISDGQTLVIKDGVVCTLDSTLTVASGARLNLYGELVENNNLVIEDGGSFLKNGSISLSIDSWTWSEDNGNANAPVIVSETNDVSSAEIKYKPKGEGDEWYTTSVPSEPGTYTVSVTLSANEHYFAVTDTCDFEILKADSGFIEKPSAIEGLVYTGTAQPIIKKGVSFGGAIEYSLDGEIFFELASNGNITETRAGEYTVYYRIAENPHYNGTEVQSLTVTVSKATPTVSAPMGLEAKYGQKLSEIYVIPALNGSWHWQNADAYVGEVGTATHKADFYPYDANNYNNVLGIDVNVTVKKADVTLSAYPAKIENLVYNGEAQALITAGVSNYGALLYKLEGGEYSTEIPKATDSGYYNVYYKVAEGSNYNAFSESMLQVYIKQKNSTPEIPTGLKATFGSSLSDVELPEDDNGSWYWESPLDYVGGAGENEHKAIYYPNSDNYTVVFTSITVSVEKAIIKVNAENASVEQYFLLPELKYTVTGFIGDDGFVTPPSISTDASDTKTAGEYSIFCSGADAGANYAIEYVDAILTVREHVDHRGGEANCTDGAICEICSSEYIQAKGHQYDNNCDASCNSCGAVRAVGAHVDADRNYICDECASELEKEGLSGGAIAGITAGSATALGAGGFSLFWFVIKKKKWSDLFKKK